jgi:tetratricopeptide (TPR) repeat protein
MSANDPDSGSHRGASTVRRIPRRPRLTRVRRVLLGLAVVLAVAGAFSARPLYRLAKVHRGRQAAERAETLVREGQTDAAMQEFRLAYQLAPKDPTVLRGVARLNTMVGSPDAYRFHQALLDTGAATLEDRLAAVEVAIRAEQRDEAGRLVQVLLREAPNDRRVWRQAFQHTRRFSSLADGVALARNLVARFPGDAEAEFDLGSLLLKVPGAGARAEGFRLLWGVALGRHPSREPAARLLAEQSEVSRAEALTLARVLEGASSGELESRLVAAQLRIRASPEARDEWVERVVSWVGPDSPVPEVVGVVQWLERHEALDRAGRFLPVERCRTNLSLMGVFVDHLVAARREEDLEALIGSRDTVLDSAMGLAARGAMQARLGRRSEAERAFRDAMAAGGRRHLVLPYVAREAIRAGAREVAAEALNEWMYLPGGAATAGRRLVQLLENQPDMEASREALRRLNGLLPSEDWVTAELGWTELFTGGNFDWARHEFERLHRQWPADPSLRVALALSRWRDGDAVAALKLLEPERLDPAAMDARQKAACAVILGANGQREAARAWLRGIPRERIRVQMQQLLEPLM